MSIFVSDYDDCMNTRRHFIATGSAIAAGSIAPPLFAGFTEDEYAAHIKTIKFPGEGFSVVTEKPFVVIGDEGKAMVKARATNTVGWAVRKLKQAYFTKDPDHIINVWLFKNKTSYEANTKKLWGKVPSTPYGYYSKANRVLVMNIATGGGTLVHEIVHPFMAANFPACPAWFNEGLASLYEQSGERNGQIVGRTNWRLAGLQKGIAAGKLGTFERLTGTTQGQFYFRDKGANYAQARYLCYYLQQHGKLRDYYKSFTANAGKDPTGYKTLGSVLAIKDWADFENSWRAWAMKLKYPPST